jgi:hypothetical protein
MEVNDIDDRSITTERAAIYAPAATVTLVVVTPFREILRARGPAVHQLNSICLDPSSAVQRDGPNSAICNAAFLTQRCSRSHLSGASQ